MTADDRHVDPRMLNHDAPRKGRVSHSRPIRTKPPKCDGCGLDWAPYVDHTECRKEQK